jgi:hypothetical protein
MRFSEATGIQRSGDDDWFDPHLTVDTKLFIDPLLLLDAGGEWEVAHTELVGHFAHCYELVARAPSRTSVSARLARCQGMPACAAEVRFLQDIGDMRAGECQDRMPRGGAFLPITFPALARGEARRKSSVIPWRACLSARSAGGGSGSGR